MRDIIDAYRERGWHFLLLDFFILLLVIGLLWTSAGKPHPFAPHPVAEESV